MGEGGGGSYNWMYFYLLVDGTITIAGLISGGCGAYKWTFIGVS